MPSSQVGLVVGKDFKPLPGKGSGDWCFITIDLSEDERISVRVTPSQAKKVGIGDVVRFRRPRSHNRPLKSMKRLASEPGLLP